MTKSASPIRLQNDLMNEAKLTAKRFHRSTAEQIEYWADIGKNVSNIIDPDVLLSVKSGLTVLKAEAVNSQPVDPNHVFKQLQNQQESGELSGKISTSAFRYQASKHYEGFLEQIDQEGHIKIGQFKNGEFTPIVEPHSEQ